MGTGAAALVAAALAVVVVTRLWTVLVHLVWRPYAVARAFARQGVRGPPYRVFVGNSKEVQAMRGGDERRHAGPHLPRLHPARDAAVPRVDVTIRYASGQDQF